MEEFDMNLMEIKGRTAGLTAQKTEPKIMNSKSLKIYLSGAITDNLSYKDMFAEAERKCFTAGYTPISPVKLEYDNFPTKTI